MIAQPKPPYMTPQEYLEWEENQPIKYEYINGEVYAMTGGTLPHNDIAVNLTAALRNHLRGRGCKVRMADSKVGVSEKGPFHYPDVVVTWDQRDFSARQVMYHPCLIVEVLSPGTEAFDRGKKFTHYRRIESLREYVLINPNQMSIECYRINDNRRWELIPYSINETTPQGTEPVVELTSINFSCPISTIYEDVVFPAGEDDSNE